MFPMILSIVYFICVILVAQFAAPSTYQWTVHSVSELASQGLPTQWIMQAGFIGFGLLINLAFVLKFRRAGHLVWPDLLIMLYGASILLAGIFSTAPYLQGLPFSEPESRLHSLFATLAGVAFSIAILIYTIQAGRQGWWLHAIFLVLVMGLSAAFGMAENGQIAIGRGIVQRSMYLVSFAWLIISQWQAMAQLQLPSRDSAPGKG